MMAAENANGVIVLVAGALVAGLSALVKAWFENRDARKAAERQLDVAIKRTQFVKEWIAVSKSFGENEQARANALQELNEAYSDAQFAIQKEAAGRVSIDQRVIQQLRYLLMVERRSNAWSYVVGCACLLLSTAVALDVFSPVGGSLAKEAAFVLATTLTLRVIAGLMVRELEQHGDKEIEASVADQVNHLLMFRYRRNPLSYVVSALFLGFLASILVGSVYWYNDDLDSDPYGLVGCYGVIADDAQYTEVSLLDKAGKPLTEERCAPLEGENDSGGVFYVNADEVIPACSGADDGRCIEYWYYFPPAPAPSATLYIGFGLALLLAGRLIAGVLVRWLERFSSRRSASKAALPEPDTDDSALSNTPDPVG